jgi:hypothetical protein
VADAAIVALKIGEAHPHHKCQTSVDEELFDVIPADVASDVAFLAMDFDYHGRPDLSRQLTERMAAALGDRGMLHLLDFYIGLRPVAIRVSSGDTMVPLPSVKTGRFVQVSGARRSTFSFSMMVNALLLQGIPDLVASDTVPTRKQVVHFLTRVTRAPSVR